MNYKSIYDIRIGDLIYFISNTDNVYSIKTRRVSRIDISGTCIANTVAEVYLVGNDGAIGVTISQNNVSTLRTCKESAQEWCNFMNKKTKEKGYAK